MSRSGYSEDCEFLNLWRENVKRTVFGKRGQKFLQELVQALDEMPEKKLIRGSLKTKEGVCAIGALGVKKGINMDVLDPEDCQSVGQKFSISTMMVQEICYQNDEIRCGQSAEERWKIIYEWAKSNLNQEEKRSK